MGENNCKSYSDKWLISKIYKEVLQLNSKKKKKNQTTLSYNGQRTWIDFSLKAHKCPTNIWKEARHHKLSGKYKSKPQGGCPWWSSGQEPACQCRRQGSGKFHVTGQLSSCAIITEPSCLKPLLCNEKPPQRESCTQQQRGASACTN